MPSIWSALSLVGKYFGFGIRLFLGIAVAIIVVQAFLNAPPAITGQLLVVTAILAGSAAGIVALGFWVYWNHWQKRKTRPITARLEASRKGGAFYLVSGVLLLFPVYLLGNLLIYEAARADAHKTILFSFIYQDTIIGQLLSFSIALLLLWVTARLIQGAVGLIRKGVTLLRMRRQTLKG